MFQMSHHSKERAAQRRLTPEELEYVRQFGKRYFCEGARVFYLREKDLPPGDRRRRWGNLVGTAVVMSLDMQVVITTWRNRKAGLKFIRQRSGGARPGHSDRGRSDYSDRRRYTSPWEKDLLDDRLFMDDEMAAAIAAALMEEEAAEEVAALNYSIS